jgi:hypothetical protein
MAYYNIIIKIEDPDIDAAGLSVVFEEFGDVANIVKFEEGRD